MDFSFSSMDLFYSSYSDITPIPPQYQVFINFRGEELREGFVEILVQALKKEQVNVFVDEDEVRGEDLNILFDRIQNSKIAITIFSEKYTESKWCLNELVEIEECMKRGRLHVIPIFLNVITEDVKHLSGNFGDNFRRLRKTYPKNSKIAAKWKKALKSVSRKFGLPANLRYQRGMFSVLFGHLYYEYFAQSIVEEVKKVLIRISEREDEIMRERRNREEFAEANRNTLWGKTKELIYSVVPKGVLVFLLVLVVAQNLLCIVCIVLYYSGSFDKQSIIEW